MTLEDYEARIDQLVANCLARERSVYEVVGEQTDRHALADFRLQLLNDSDIRSCVGFLSTGIFAGEPESTRLGLLLVTLEVERQVSRTDIRSRCGRYNDSPLLARLPALSEYVRDDLISVVPIQQLSGSDVVRVPGGFARIEALLNPCVAAWALGSFPPERVRLRLDPREGGHDRPPAESGHEN